MNTDARNRTATHLALNEGRVWCGSVLATVTTNDPHAVTCADCRRRMPRC